jgi:iron complex outermembrane receptor protein
LRDLQYIFLLFLIPFTLTAQEAEKEVIQLPEVAVTEEREAADRVSREQMDREGSTDLWEAMRNVPGVIRSGGGGTDNESGFKVRGFDESHMPVFVDDVPLSSPYWGNSDYARLLTADLESVDIQKGYSSMLLGPNTMGGAVLLRTAKPKKALEIALDSGFGFDSIGKYASTVNALSLGTKQEYFYGKAVFQYRDVDHFRLPGSFTPYDRNPQGTGDRIHSDSRDTKLTLLTGWTPNALFDVNVSYVYQDADKGESPPPVKGQVFRTDTWPLWRRHLVKLDGGYSGERGSAKTLVYFDKYDTTLVQENGLVKKETENDDYALGVRLEGRYDINSWNTLGAALNFKQESHRGNDDRVETLRISENIWSGGAEYSITPWRPLTISAGLGFDILQPVDFFTVKDLTRTAPKYMFAWQGGLFYRITENHEVRFTHAKKNRVPTMGQRYEEIRQDAIPNPDLKNETARHYELGYKGQLASRIRLNAAAYYADLLDMIAEARVSTATGGTTKVRRNIDKTAYYGFELGLDARVNAYLGGGGALSINRYKLKSNADDFKVDTNFPRTTMSAWLEINPLGARTIGVLESLAIIPSLEYEGPRYGPMTIYRAGDVLDRYILLNTKITAGITTYITLSVSAENILDQLYALDDGELPLAGRTFRVTVQVRY